MKRTKRKKSVKSKKSKSSPIATGADQDIIGLLTMLVQKLTAFEAKLDILLKYIQSQPLAVTAKQQLSSVIPSAKPKHDRENKYMYKAVCADCGMNCEVPFKPREDRQVYCKVCFAKRRSKGILKPQELNKPKTEAPVYLQQTQKKKPVQSRKSLQKKKKPKVEKKKTKRK